ncbi:MAG: hypothetical protein LBT30_02180 [Clostridiales bacterium]|jgi:hypothetical protein|nr:hypothetical protein [Clostridiales bacterium]
METDLDKTKEIVTEIMRQNEIAIYYKDKTLYLKRDQYRKLLEICLPNRLNDALDRMSWSSTCEGKILIENDGSGDGRVRYDDIVKLIKIYVSESDLTDVKNRANQKLNDKGKNEGRWNLFENKTDNKTNPQIKNAEPTIEPEKVATYKAEYEERKEAVEKGEKKQSEAAKAAKRANVFKKELEDVTNSFEKYTDAENDTIKKLEDDITSQKTNIAYYIQTIKSNKTMIEQQNKTIEGNKELINEKEAKNKKLEKELTYEKANSVKIKETFDKEKNAFEVAQQKLQKEFDTVNEAGVKGVEPAILIAHLTFVQSKLNIAQSAIAGKTKEAWDANIISNAINCSLTRINSSLSQYGVKNNGK